MKVKIGLQLAPQHGDMHRMREAWMEAEALGADSLFSADHFHAQAMDSDDFSKGQMTNARTSKNFEGTTIQAAMAATTTRPEIGCLVHAIGYRNPNLLADMARTIDHISGGRFILGLGAGYLKEDFEEYGYPYGTQASRLQDLANALPIIKARFEKLNPKPLRKIPILIATTGEKIGMPIAAKHADMWHLFGTMDKIIDKFEKFRNVCVEVGRDPSEIEVVSSYMPQWMPDTDPDVLCKLGIRNFLVLVTGPDWDLGPLRELLEWRKTLG